MPPSHHSHSSHSSHHSSSSHSSHSSHSRSSHSSSSGRSYHSSSSHASRPRTNQPKGWNNIRHGNYMSYNLREHDYIYYPHDWQDESGNRYKEGYYDENGQYYTNIAAPNVETLLTCTYCGAKMLYKWQEGVFPNCPSCGAQFQIDKIDAEHTFSSSVNTHPLKVIGIIYLVMFIILMAVAMPMILISSMIQKHYEDDSYKPDSVYVSEIGRECKLDGEDYYDEESKCWFWFNDEVSPAQWQYWYEGISDDYGDYGWMEYDDTENVWYIETSRDNWQTITIESKDEERVWHFDDAYKNDIY